MGIFDDRRRKVHGAKGYAMRDSAHTGRDDSPGRRTTAIPLTGPLPGTVLVRSLRTMLDSSAAAGITKQDMALSVEAIIGVYEDKTGKVD